ncbi:HipA domain-containing protein [Pontibacter mangrovi]|uniref:HipA domain-containing protein n=2 Tax=Pontibacter mangrovi TaxID=2589816 RepID=A0A501W494_9BACT|nr:HipA domain-containing protein [Pontibacter mangrovi]
MKRCLYCYQPLAEHERDFHGRCSKRLFGQAVPPDLPYTEAQMEQLAEQVVRNHAAVTGVQPKLSLDLAPGPTAADPKRFTIVGLWGGYILKPPSPHYAQRPEVEDLTMHLATIAGITVVPHSLIRLKSGNLSYITKRIDRTPKGKLHMEDMCQLTERLTEDKYYGSYEQIAKAILRHSVNPGLDVINFFEQVLFSFLTGNADMHLKNFSLLHQPGFGPVLAPAYDLVATVVVNPADDEDLALMLNGKRKKIKKADFIAAFNTLKLNERQQQNLFNKMVKAKAKWVSFIDTSFLSQENKEAYRAVMHERFSRLGLGG